MVYPYDEERTPIHNAKMLTGYILQTIDNHMLHPLENGKPRDQKRDLERIKNDLSKLSEILNKIE